MHTSSPYTIYVCPLDAIETVVARARPSHLISLVNSETMSELKTPPGISPQQHLRLIMNDINAPLPGHVAPSPEHVAALVDFVTGWQREAPLMINCLAGISRSTAAAFTIMCALNDQTDEMRLARLLRERSPTAQPNLRLVGFADEVLGREGRMIDAIKSLGAGAVYAAARPFTLPAYIAPGD